jgi:hypothetical protein
VANTTWNPSDKDTGVTLSGGNLTATTGAGGFGWVRAVDKQVTGKFYWEITCTTFASGSSGLGIARSIAALSGGPLVAGTCTVNRAGTISIDGTSAGISIGTIVNGTVVCIAFDAAARLIWFRSGAAGNWNNNASNNPATSVGGVATYFGLAIPAYPFFSGVGASDAGTANFGDSAFVGTVPSGFTSGWPAGVTSPTNALATQVALEHWLATNPPAQVTQVALEHWASTSSAAVQAVVTQVALEHWAAVAAASTGGPMVTVIL